MDQIESQNNHLPMYELRMKPGTNTNDEAVENQILFLLVRWLKMDYQYDIKLFDRIVSLNYNKYSS